ncbi:arylamine N-acetyltransferase-like [Haemaphysalis longicornis]
MDTLTSEQTAAYLARLGVPKPVSPDLDTLRSLVEAHLTKVAFENVDVLLHRPINLDANSLFAKIVERGRGGYCFELNSFFARLLQAMDYRLRLRLARVCWGMPRDAPTRHNYHLVLIVQLFDKDYLVDVGIGGPNPYLPLPLIPGMEGAEHPYTLRTPDAGEDFESGTLELCVRGGDDWIPIYRIDPHDQLWEDCVPLNWYMSTHPNSIMRRWLLLGRSDSKGWLTLVNGRYRRRLRNAGCNAVERRDIQDVDELLSILREKFCLHLSPDKDVEPLRGRLTDILGSNCDR